MPVLVARLGRCALSSVITSALFVVACPSLRAQSPATAGAPSDQPLPASSAVLIVEPPPAESDAQWQRRIQTHVATIASEHHLRRVLAVDISAARNTQWFKSTGDPAERAAWLRDHLRVRAVPGTSLIELALPDLKEPAERRTVLSEVGNAYLAERGQLNAVSLTDRIRVLSQLADKIKSRLAALAVEEQAPVNAGAGGTDRITARGMEEEEKGLRERLRQIQSQLDQLAATVSADHATDIHWQLLPNAVPAR